MAKSLEETVFLDRLLRTIQLLDFRNYFTEPLCLFLNFVSMVATMGHNDGDFFKEILAWTGVDPQKPVIEILKAAIRKASLLTKTVANYRE
ncbi:MAG: diguanylate phosphodiesterase [Leptospirillum sp. Group IV 'UBA BS']|jgi:hypothetical protein|nr:MAG: diguanylate phosphodiesterase [Leptospirillum sp. Group IV 'UBA BS']